MKPKSRRNILAAVVVCIASWGATPRLALAQVAGSTMLGITTTESSRSAIGWSVRESILGQDVYNEIGGKIGKIEDLIVDRARSVSFLIVGVGGVAGMGRHAVAIRASQIEVVGDRLVLAGATRQSLAGMPPFVYAPSTRSHNSIVERAERDIDKANRQITLLQLQSDAASETQRQILTRRIADLEAGRDAVEEKIAAMNASEGGNWKAVEHEVGATSARLRSIMKTLSR